MNSYRKIALILILFPLFFLGQEKPAEKLNARFVIKTSAGIPKPITSNLFRKSFNGFYDLGISFNFRTVGNFYFGIGYQNVFFKNNAYLKQQVYNASIPYDTRLLADIPFVAISYDKYFKSDSYIKYSLNYGYILGKYTNVNPDTSEKNKPLISKGFSGQYIRPEVSFNFIDKDNTWVSFSVMVSYTTLLYKYDPRSPRFAHFYELQPISNRYAMSWLTVGFGINVLLGQSKE
ncbi:MAG: hypothetical protein IPI93_13005 [Sphingobacteriaceae bacterium]|nr:hypothetical protein [Sphingobacteriaceae bacterium]